MLLQDRELTAQATKIESLLTEIESFPDPAARAKAAEIVQCLLGLYGEGLARILDIVHQQADPPLGTRIFDALAADELVAHLLLLHSLHPVPLEDRVAAALESVRPYLKSHGGNVELIGVEDGIAQLRLQGSCHGCPSSAMTLKMAIEEALWKAAPDLEGIETEGVSEPEPPATFIPLSALTPRESGSVARSAIPVRGE